MAGVGLGVALEKGAARKAIQAALDEMAAVQPTPEQVVLSRNELMRLEAALAELPERVRIAVEMHRFGGAKGWGAPLGGVIGSELWRERAKDPPPLPAAIVGVGVSEAFGTLISSSQWITEGVGL